MGGHLILERYYWFDSRIRANKFPNANSISEYFEISTRTARRNIEFMRDRLMAPLEYNPARKGYQYADPSFTLPPLQDSQEEMVSILMNLFHVGRYLSPVGWYNALTSNRSTRLPE